MVNSTPWLVGFVLMAGSAFAQSTPVVKAGAALPPAPSQDDGSSTASFVGGSDNCAACDMISGLGTFAFNLTSATTGSQGQANANCLFFNATGIANDVWYCWTATVTGTVNLSMCGLTTLDTKCAVYPTPGCPISPAIACNDDSCNSLQSAVCWPATAGTTYGIQLGLFPGSTPGTGSFTISTVGACCQPPGIVAQPQNATACNGGNVTLTVTAAGPGQLSYNWYRNGGAVSGGTSTSLTTNVAGTYFVTITNSCSAITSASVTVTTANSPQSTVSPVGIAGCPNALGATITATPSGGGLYSYQWTRNGTAISGATSSSYGTGPPSAATVGVYRVVVTNACGSATSLNSCTLSMYDPVAITSQPASLSRCVGASASFSVTATGQATISYQWKRNGFPIGGAIASSFSIPTVATTDAGTYTCTCTNTCGSVTSADAVLTVSPSTAITLWPNDQTVCEGATLNLDFTAVGGSPLNVEWRNPQGLVPSITTHLTLSPVTMANGGEWRCVAASPCGGLVQKAFILTVIPTAFTVDPALTTTCLGSQATLTVQPAGTAQTTYQWYFNGVLINGAAAGTYSIANVSPAEAGSYTCVCTNACGANTSSASVLTTLSSMLVTSSCGCDSDNGPCFATSSTTPGNPARNSAAGRGCVNSLTNSAGARLAATGTSSIQGDTLVLSVTGVPDAPALLYQSTTLAPMAFSMDGLWCLPQGAVLLCATTSGTAGGFGQNSSAFPNTACSSGLAILGSLTGATTRHYQVRYKDYSAWCTSNTSNSTNVLSIVWCP